MEKKHIFSPTMKDVAREAGVSLGTVSKVINGIPVGESYRRRVEAATKQLGYTVNNYARGLKTNRTYCVALVLPSIRHPFFAALADEVTASLTRRGYRCILMITNFDPAAEQKSFDMVRQNKIDGVIALTYSPDIETDDSLPIVTIDRHFGPGTPCISSDNYRGGQLAAEKLLELGCKKLLLFQIGSEVAGEPHKRGAGFIDACRANDARYDPLILKDRETEAPFFRYLEEHVRDGRADFDGIFCSSDGLAVRVRDALAKQRVNVPEDVQIIGYDGIINYATHRIDCSTIIQPIGQMAETAVELLLSSEQRALGANICLPVQYVSGGTTKDTPKEA